MLTLTRISISFDVLLSGCGEVVVEPGSEEVEDLHEADHAQPRGQSEEPADVGHKVDRRVHLFPLLRHKVEGFVVQMQYGQIVGHKGLVLELGMLL